MRFYPQLVLWTYILLPAICLLLTPSYILALAKAQQQRAKVMANVVAARSKAAAAIARNHQRRYVPVNKYSSSFGQNKPFKFKPKRELDMIQNETLPVNPENDFQFITKTKSEVQDSSVGSMHINDERNKHTNSANEPMVQEASDQPDEPPLKFFKVNNPNEPEPQRIKGVADIVPSMDKKHREFNNVFERKTHWDQQEEALDQLQNMWNMNDFGNTQNDRIMRSSSSDLNPEKQIKEKVGSSYLDGKKHHKNDGKSDYYSGAFSGRNVFDEVLDSHPISNVQNENTRALAEERSADPDPTLKLLMKKFEKKHEPYPYPPKQYNSYYPQQSYSSPPYYPYARSIELEDLPHITETDNMGAEMIGTPALAEEKSANPDPTLKLLMKKFEKKHEPYPYPYPPKHYNSYYPQQPYSSSSYYPYARSIELEDVPHITETDNMGVEMIGTPTLAEEKSANPEPTLDLLLKKFGKKHEPHPYPYPYPPINYNSYYPQQSYYSSSYYPSARNVELEEIPHTTETHNMGVEMIGTPALAEERSANPQPTLSLLLKKLEDKHEPYPHPPIYYNYYYPQNHYHSYYPQQSYSSSSYYPQQSYSSSSSYPYARNVELEEMPQTIETDNMKIEMTGEQLPQSTEPELADSGMITGSAEEDALHDGQEQGTDNLLLGEENFRDMEQKAANPEPHHSHNKPKMNHRGDENFFYSSNFYPRENEDEARKSDDKQESLPSQVTNISFSDPKNGKEPQQKVTDELELTNNKSHNASSETKIQDSLADALQIKEKDVSKTDSENVGSRMQKKDGHDDSEDVGCELEDDLFDDKKDHKDFDPLPYYQRTVDGLSEGSKKLIEASKKFLDPIQIVHPEQKPLLPVTDKPQEPVAEYVSSDETSDNNDHLDDVVLEPQDSDSSPLEVKSADPYHKSHGFSHTHTHFHSHTHGITHEKNLGKLHGSHSSLVTPQVHLAPNHHSQVFPQKKILNTGFSQANAKAQTFQHGDIQNSFTQSNSKSFSTSFGQNAAISQTKTQAFNNGGFGHASGLSDSIIPNSGQVLVPSAHSNAQGFQNSGFGHSAAQSATGLQSGSFGQSTAQATSGLQSGSFGQSAAQAATGLQSGSFGQSAAQAAAGLQSGGFGHSAAHATAGLQSGSFGQSAAQAAAGLQSGSFGQSAAQATADLQSGSFGQSAAQAATGLHSGSFGQSAAQAASGLQSGSFGQSAAQATAGLQSGSFGQSAAQAAAGFQSGSFGQSAAQAIPQIDIRGHNVAQNFENGFNDNQGFSYNNPKQFSNYARTPIVGQRKAEETFVMPHLEELPLNNLLSEMESSIHRFSRSPNDFQDALNGLGLASNIVDTSLDENKKEMFSNEPKDAQKTMSFVTNIVDSSIKAGDDNLDADSSNDFQAEEGKKTMGFVTNIVDSSLKAGERANENNANFQPLSQTPLNAGAARHLTLQGLNSLTDLVSRGLRMKRQVENDNVAKQMIRLGETTKTSKENILQQNLNKVLHTSDEMEKDTAGSNSYVNKNNQRENKTDTNEEKHITHAGTNETGKEKEVLGMIDPDLLIPTPEIITNEPWASNWDYVNKRVIYDIPEKKIVPVTNQPEITNFNDTNKGLDKGNNFSAKPNVSGDLAKTEQEISKESPTNGIHGIENPKEVFLINPVTEKENLDLNIQNNTSNHTSDLDNIETKTFSETSIASTDMPSEIIKNISDTDTAKKNFENATTFYLNGPQNEEAINHEESILGSPPEWFSSSPVSDPTDDSKKTHDDEHLRNELGVSLQAMKNKSISNVGMVKENVSSGAPGDTLPFLFYADGTRKNVSDLTSDEIQELQFDIPSSFQKINITTPRSIENRTMTMFPEVSSQNRENSLHNDDAILGMFPQRSNKTVKTDILEHPTIKQLAILNDYLNYSFHRKMWNSSSGLFDSLEEEIESLTDEEKNEFFEQEIDLLLEVIEEALRKNGLENWLKKYNETERINTNNIKEPAKKESDVASPHLFQASVRNDNREEYSRQARAPNPSEKILNTLLDQHKQKIEVIKNVASDDQDENHDNDLLMISFIGDSVVKDLEKRKNTTTHDNKTKRINEDIEINELNLTDQITDESLSHKTKRETTNLRLSRAPLTQLITDPGTKLDIEKTLQNLESIAKHTFENPRAPMYHVRNMLGNAKNSVMSAAKVAPNNFLIPSKYEIAKISRNNDEQVGAINKKMLFSRGGFQGIDREENVQESSNDKVDPFGFEDTVQKIGGMVQQSVQSGREAVAHVNDVAADAKKFLYTSKNVAPRLIMPLPKPILTSRGAYTPLQRTPLLGIPQTNTPSLGRKIVLITPRIFEVQDNIVGAAQENPENFIGMGRILDATGLSHPNQPEVEYQKITIEPFNNMKQFTQIMPSNTGKTLTNDNVREETNEPNDTVGSQQFSNEATQDLLQNDQQSPVTENLNDFIRRMHDEMKEIVRSQYEEIQRKRKQRIKPKINPYYQYQKENNYYKQPIKQTVVPKYKVPPHLLGDANMYYNARNNYNENVGMTLPLEKPERNSDKNKIRGNEDNRKKFSDIPAVNSKIQQQLTNNKPVEKYVQQIQNLANIMANSQKSNNTDNDEKVELSLPANLMKPFMGQPSKALLDDFMRENGDEDVLQQISLNSTNSNNADEEENVEALLPPNLMKPFMGQASDTLIKDYMRENGNTGIKNSQKALKPSDTKMPVDLYTSFPTVKPLEPVNNFLDPEVPQPTDLDKRTSASDTSLRSLGFNIPKTKSLSTPNISSKLTKPEILGAAMPKDIAEKESLDEKTKELVKSLSDPEIDESEIMENKGSLDLNINNEDEKKSNSDPKKAEFVPALQNTGVSSSTKKPLNSTPSNLKGNKHVQTTNNSTDLNNDNMQDLKKQNNFSSSHKTPLTVAHVPDEEDLGYVLGALTPEMFEKYFKERLKVNDNESKNTHNELSHHEINKNIPENTVHPNSGRLIKNKLNEETQQEQKVVNNQLPRKHQLNQNLNDKIVGQTEENLQLQNNPQNQEENDDGDFDNTNSTSRTSMAIPGPYKKPFMGHISKKKVHDFLNQYNNNLPEGNEDEHYGQEYDGYQDQPTKDVVLPWFDEEGDNYYVF